MKIKAILVLSCLIGLLLKTGTAQDKQTATKPVLFGEGVISTRYREWTTTFTPDGKTVYFTRGGVRYVILFSKYVKGKWQSPKIAPFSGRWYDTDPFICADGKRLYFCSNRPADQSPSSKPDKNAHIWYVEKKGNDKWTPPVCLDAGINYPGVSTWYPSESSNGNFYFHSWRRPGGHGFSDLYMSRHVGDKFSPPELLPADTVGFSTQEGRVSPGNDYLVFVSDRPGGFGKSDLYITFHKDSLWSKPVNLGPQINQPGETTMAPALSVDGKILYFVNGSFPKPALPLRVANYQQLLKQMDSIYNGSWNIFYVPLDIEKLRNAAVWPK